MIRYLMILVVALASSVALAGGDDSSYHPQKRVEHNPPLDAKPIIAHCWKISLALRSTGSTSAHRNGAMDTAICLENAIAEHATALFAENEADKKKILQQLEQIRSGYGGLYWSIFNDVKTCDFSCGTIFHSFHNWKLAKLYEKILTDIIAQRNEYGA